MNRYAKGLKLNFPYQKSEIASLELRVGFLVLLLGLFTQINLISASAQNQQLYFNCELLAGEQKECYPSSAAVSAYSTEGKFKRVYETYSNSSTFAEGKYGKALSFQALLGEYVNVPISRNDLDSNFSISFWMNEEPWFTSRAPILSYINANSSAGWLFDTQDNGTAVRFGITNAEGEIVAPDYVTIEPDNFVNIIGTFDGSLIKIYKDGILYSTANYTGMYNPDPGVNLRIGLNSFDNEDSWAGSIDELRIYNRTVSADEAKLIYYTPNKMVEDLVGYWTFDDTLMDKSGNGHDAKLRIQTVGMDFAPDGRMFFTVKRTGEIRVMENENVLSEPFAKLSDLYLGDHEGILGITLDPKFNENHLVYVYSTHEDNNTGLPFNRVTRIVDNNNRGENMTVILDGIPADEGGNYAGGALTFGPDDKLYVTVGMGPRPLDAQNMSSVLGKVLRINRDGTIPSDNPFRNSPVYTLGHRSMFGIAFDNKTGMGLLTENGDTSFDEINLIKKGANYGFPRIQHPTVSSVVSNTSFVSPIRSYENVIAPAQIIFYTGNKYPELQNRFVFSSYNDGNLHALKIYDNESGVGVNELNIHIPQDLPDNLVGIAQSISGDIYFSGYDIYRLESIDYTLRQTMFPVQTNSSSGIDVVGMNVSVKGSNMLITVTGKSSTPATEAGSVYLKIPKYSDISPSLISSESCEKYADTDTSGIELLVKCTPSALQNTNGTLLSLEIGPQITQ
jgi:glucose/arabinose dehydrogenase